MGEVHAWLRRHAPRWTVLRPTWFAQNFSEALHLATIRDEGRIYSATDDGRVPFIDAEDIAAVAAEALVGPERPNGELPLTGPACLGYDDVTAIVSAAAGRPVAHHRLSVPALAARYEAVGILSGYAQLRAGMDAAIAGGSEDRLSPAVRQVLGREPRSFEAFAAAAAAWRPG